MSDIFLMAMLPGCSGDRLLRYWFEVDRFDLDQPSVDLPVADALQSGEALFRGFDRPFGRARRTDHDRALTTFE